MIFAQKYQRLLETFLSGKVSSKITCIRNKIQILKKKKPQKKALDFYKNKNV